MRRAATGTEMEIATLAFQDNPDASPLGEDGFAVA